MQSWTFLSIVLRQLVKEMVETHPHTHTKVDLLSSLNSRTPLITYCRQMEAETESEKERNKVIKKVMKIAYWMFWGGKKGRGNCRSRDRQTEWCTILWSCLSSTRVCQQYNLRIYRGTESLIFYPHGTQIWWLFHFKAALRSLSQMAQRQTFPLQPLCTCLSTA